MRHTSLPRRDVLAILMTGVAASLALSGRALPAEKPGPSPDAATRPNILIIFTDDQGYADLGCYGSKTNKTPRMDRLAEEGTRFTSFYAQPVCGPSRSALLTGRYWSRFGNTALNNNRVMPWKTARGERIE